MQKIVEDEVLVTLVWQQVLGKYPAPSAHQSEVEVSCLQNPLSPDNYSTHERHLIYG
jgi:hypothetical protein